MRRNTIVRLRKLDFNRFEVDFRFNPKIIEVCKSIPGRKFNMVDKKWSFPINQYSVLLKQIETFPHIQFKKKLTKNELADFQVIIYEEEPDFIISFPPNEELKKFVKDLGGKWLDDQFCWHIMVDKKQLLLDHIRDKKIKTFA